jgi:hypothetical protein
MQSTTRTKRVAAFKAIEKISAILKEAEKYDDYGVEIEESFELTKESINFIPKESKMIPNPSVEIEKSVEVPKEESKKTPNTVHNIATDENAIYSAYMKYNNALKSINIANIKEYLTAAEKNENRYFILPELMKYLIANPVLMMYNEIFGTTVVNKMLEFEAQMTITKNVSGLEITEEYRREFLGLVRILKNISQIYGKIKLNDQSFYENITSISDSI